MPTTNFLGTFIVTAYCSCKLCCGTNSSLGLAANGHKPTQGITIAGPRAIPFESKVIIDGVGTRIVQDRLAIKYDNRFDVYFTNHTEAKQFGIKKVKIWQVK